MGNGKYSKQQLERIDSRYSPNDCIQSSYDNNRFEPPEYCDGFNMYDDNKFRMYLNDIDMITAASIGVSIIGGYG